MRSTLLKRVTTTALATSLAAFGLVAVTTSTARAAGPACQRTYSSGTINAPIPDYSGGPGSVTSTIDVPEDGLVVSDVDVTLDIHHTFDSDLSIELNSLTDASIARVNVSPFLVSHAGGNGDNFLGTVIDDQAPTPVGWGAAPFAGRFSPDNELSALNGFAGGKYVLRIFDNVGGDTGMLNDWSITLGYASCDFDSDGVEDHVDQCLSIAAHTATGCPLTSRTATVKYKSAKFKGVLASPVGACTAGRLVTIWKVRGGADKRVGTATTNADGSYRLKRGRHAGKYYATSPLVAVADAAECPAVTSTTFTIH